MGSEGPSAAHSGQGRKYGEESTHRAAVAAARIESRRPQRFSPPRPPPAVAPAGNPSSGSANRDVQGVGIGGGGGYDLINNRGAIAVQPPPPGGPQPPQCDSYSDNKHDDAHGQAPAKPAAASIG